VAGGVGDAAYSLRHGHFTQMRRMLPLLRAGHGEPSPSYRPGVPPILETCKTYSSCSMTVHWTMSPGVYVDRRAGDEGRSTCVAKLECRQDGLIPLTQTAVSHLAVVLFSADRREKIRQVGAATASFSWHQYILFGSRPWSPSGPRFHSSGGADGVLSVIKCPSVPHRRISGHGGPLPGCRGGADAWSRSTSLSWPESEEMSRGSTDSGASLASGIRLRNENGGLTAPRERGIWAAAGSGDR
jgi:hypothetical protein